MFTMPVVYEKHQVSLGAPRQFDSRLVYEVLSGDLLDSHLHFQAQIDQYVGLIRTQVNSVVGK